jgi:ribosome-associated protein
VVIRAEVLSFSFVASQGPGGQNVNKRATKCVLRVRLDELPLTAEQLARLCRVAPSRVTQDGELVVTSDEHRSQERNRTACVGRLRELVRQSLVAPKVRRPTKPSRGAKERRLEGKRQRADTKRRRRDGGGGAE